MTVLIIDPITCPKKEPRAPVKMILFDSPDYHVWVHGPDEPGEKGPMHKHAADETFYCVQGEATFHFPNHPSEKLAPGMMIVIPKNDFYQIESTGTQSMLLYGSRAEPANKPRLSERDEVVDEKTRWKAGANY